VFIATGWYHVVTAALLSTSTTDVVTCSMKAACTYE